jgi:hypothetical protein
MSEREPVTLESLARQQYEILAELASLRGDVDLLGSILRAIENSMRQLLEAAKGLGWNG